jgi:hypothetical protein
MVGAAVVFAVAVATQPKHEKPMALDPVTQRRVYEAWLAGQRWAKGQATHLYHPLAGVRLPPERQAAFVKMRQYAMYNLMVGVEIQVCDAYGISRSVLNKVVADPRSRRQLFIPEPIGSGEIKMATTEFFARPTRFDPEKVVLPEKIAAKIGYTNPKPKPPQGPVAIPRGMNVKPRPPGMPQELYEKQIRDEVERFKEIQERAAKAKTPNPLTDGAPVPTAR